MKIKLKSLTLNYFKGIEHMEIQFTDNTMIYGANEKGKTTIVDAFTWLLFGKNSADEKEFSIKTRKDGKEIERIPHVVKGVFDVDGTELTLERVLEEKWVKRTGKQELVFTGNETSFFIDMVPKKAGEYQKYVSELIDETVFKLVTNPHYFPSLHWAKQREQLFAMAGEISKDLVIGSNPAFAALIDKMSGKSMEDYKKQLAFKKKGVKEELEKIPIEIAQTIKMRPAPVDVEFLNSQIATKEAEIKNIDKTFENENEKSKKINADNAVITAKIGKLETERNLLISKAKAANEAKASEKNGSLEKSKKELENLREDIKTLEASIKTKNADLATAKEEVAARTKTREELLVKFEATNAATYVAKDDCLVCPLFGHECSDSTAKSKESEAYARALEVFNIKKVEDIQKIRKDGAANNEAKLTYENRIQELETSIAKDQSLLDVAKQGKVTIEGLIEAFKPSIAEDVDASKIERCVEIDAEIEELRSGIKKYVANEEVEDLRPAIRAQITELNKQLGAADIIAKSITEEKRLNERNSELLRVLDGIESDEHTIDLYSKTKVQIVEDRVSSMFEYANFSLFEYNQDGSPYEWCTILVGGVPYSDANNAAKINVGIDIINSLCKFYGVSAPIFIDNAEGVNKLWASDSQMVGLYVSTDELLIVK